MSEANGMEQRIAHSERIKREALLELRETRLKLRAAIAQVDALQQQLLLAATPASNLAAAEAGGKGEASIASEAPAMETGPAQVDAAWTAGFSERLENYRKRLSAWNATLVTFQDESTRQRKSLDDARAVLDRRIGAHEQNAQLLNQALGKLAADRGALDQARARWNREVRDREQVLQRAEAEAPSYKRDAEILRNRLKQAEDALEAQTRLRNHYETTASELQVQLRTARRATALDEDHIWRARAQAQAKSNPPVQADVPAEQVEIEPVSVLPVPGQRVQLQVQSAELLRDLLSRRAASLLDVLGHELVTCGNGPWEAEVLDDALASAGFAAHYLDDAAHEIPVFVVGREGVDVELLRWQLDERHAEGKSFWLFSQEMLVLSLLCGEDLLRGTQAPDEHLIPEFAEDHPVLSEFLTGDEWQWPDPAPRNVIVGGDRDIDAGWSPLAEFGYHVGARSEPPSHRRKVLQDFWECSGLGEYFKPRHDLEYRRRWGSPRSGSRLTRMVLHIRWLQATQGKDARKAKASKDWAADLKWLRMNLVPRVGPRWRWPSV